MIMDPHDHIEGSDCAHSHDRAFIRVAAVAPTTIAPARSVLRDISNMGVVLLDSRPVARTRHACCELLGWTSQSRDPGNKARHQELTTRCHPDRGMSAGS